MVDDENENSGVGCEDMGFRECNIRNIKSVGKTRAKI